MAKLKIAVVHPWGLAKKVDPLMWDGLHAALREVGDKHQVDWFLAGDEPDDSYDWILPWGVGSLPFNDTIEKFKGRKALLCAGHPQDTNNFDKFEAIFVESPAVYDALRPQGYRVILAFGTDIDFFTPGFGDKLFDAFYPATFSPWKRQSFFAQAVRDQGLAVGYLQPDGAYELDMCDKMGTLTMEGLIPTMVVSELYKVSRSVVITSWHGSERTALEAMACNLPVVITKDNELTASLLQDAVVVEPDPNAIREGFLEALGKKVKTREFVLDNYSHHKYARKLLSVLEN